MKASLALILLFCCITGYAQQTRQRLIAKSMYMDTGIYDPDYLRIVDSAAVSYSGDRHSVFDPNSIDYFDLNRFSGNGLLHDFFGRVAAPNNIDSLDAWPRLAFDEIIQYDVINRERYGDLPNHMETCTYNPDGTFHKLSHFYFGKNGRELDHVQELIYTSGKLSGVSWTATDVRSDSFFRYLLRNAAGHIITDSSVSYDKKGLATPVDRTTFTYNAGGQYLTRYEELYIANGYIPMRHYTNTYYADGRLQTSLVEAAPANYQPLRLCYIDSFGYLPGVPGYSRFKRHHYNSDGKTYWKPDIQYSAHINQAGQKDTITFVRFGDSIIQANEYNSYGNPVFNDFYHHTQGRLMHHRKFNYYYESYQPLNVLPRQQATYRLTPNPTSGQLQIHFDVRTNFPVTVRISNASGQLIQTNSLSFQGNGTWLDLVETIPTGTYFLSVYDAQGRDLGTKPVMKR